jgi:hypothetical protein
MVRPSHMTLSPGSRLGPYQILVPLGVVPSAVEIQAAARVV